MSQAHSNLHRSAWADWWEGTRRTDIWWTLAWFDIVLRYRRSMLGPLWLTLSMGAMIGGMGPLYSSLFGTELSKFFPHLALGIIFWGFFSSMVTDSCNAFIGSANYLKQGYFPISLFVWRSMARNLIQFAHQIVLYIPVAIWAGISLVLVGAALHTGFPARAHQCASRGHRAWAGLHAVSRCDADRHQRHADADVPHACLLAARACPAAPNTSCGIRSRRCSIYCARR